MSYKAKTGWHVTNTYMEDIFLLEIVEKEDTFDGYVLKRIPDEFILMGSTLDDFSNHMCQLVNEYHLQIRSENARDVLLIFVDNLDKVRKYFSDFITEDEEIHIQCGTIEFRSWKVFTKADVEKTMADWNDKFIAMEYPFFTPANYMRHVLKKECKGCASEVYPDKVEMVEFVYKCVQSGVMYNRPEEGLVENLLGYDICSAYIYSFLFRKHASSALKAANPELWEDYLRYEDRGSVGLYEIQYNSIFRGVRCFKDTRGEHLQPGMHTVEIALCNLDLKTLLDCMYPGIIQIRCKNLFVFDLDYLPEEFRIACAKEFIKKSTLPKGSVAQKNQKVIVNAGFYGNTLFSAKKVCTEQSPKAQKKQLKAEIENAFIAPQWGVFTMAYTKMLVIKLGLKVAGWHYSDTDSIYCDDDSYNRKLFSKFNTQILVNNVELCDELGYNEIFGEDAHYLHKLGTFELEAEISRFVCWSQKQYAYQTTDGKVVVKAAGIPEECREKDPDIVFAPGYRPSRA